MKFLVVLLDENISRKYHINEPSQKLARTCCIFLTLGKCFPLKRDYLCGLYSALFSPILQYVITVWGSTFKSYIHTIFKLQKRILELSHFNMKISPLGRGGEELLTRILDWGGVCC